MRTLSIGAKERGAQQLDSVNVPGFGGVRPDVSDVARPSNNFKDLHNYRLGKTGVPTARSGIKRYDLAGAMIPVAKCEYSLYHTPEGKFDQVNYDFDVTLYWTGSTVRMRLIDKTSDDGTFGGTLLDVEIDAGITELPKVAVMQYGLNLLVTIYSRAVFVVSPVSLPPRNFIIEQAGKDLGPMPTSIEYAKETKGDLIVFQAKNNNNKMELQYADGDPEPIKLVLPLDADYVALSEFTQPVHPFKHWVFGEKDAVPTSAEPVRSRRHIQNRGWHYRFVALQEYKDALGNTTVRRSIASADVFVRDTMYIAPHRLNEQGDFPGIYFCKTTSVGWHQGGNNFWKQPLVNSGVAQFSDLAKMNALQLKLIEYLRDQADEDPYYFASSAAGWVTATSANFAGQTPWKVEIPASELKQAPLAMFEFKNFTVPANTTAIEIYRTAYSFPDSSENAEESPLFAPNRYGYVATIHEGDEWADDVRDDEIRFGDTPERWDGYLRGFFSGQVLREYNEKIVLGNIRVDHQVLTPTELIQAFYYASRWPGYSNISLLDAADGGKQREFYYAYLDKAGYRSKAVKIDPTEPIDNWGAGNGAGVAFNFPRGYAPNIVSIVIYMSEMPAGLDRTYYEIATLPVEDGTYFSDDRETRIVVSPDVLDADLGKFYEPGAITWSDENAEFHWKLSSNEKWHRSAPVTMLEVLFGELWVLTNGSNHLTRLDGTIRRGEEETMFIGCVSRHSHSKIQTVALFLSADGVMLLDARGPHDFPGAVKQEILQYIKERVPGHPPLANVQRATAGYLGTRDEWWLHFPSSRDLWPDDRKSEALPHRTFIFRFMNGDLKSVENYYFDINPEFEAANLPPAIGPARIDPSRYRPSLVIFTPHTDGLWASYYDAEANGMVTMNCDYNEDYPGKAWGTIAIGEQLPGVTKHLDSYDLRANVRGQLTLVNGIGKKDGAIDAVRGHISDAARVWPVRVRSGIDHTYTQPIGDRSIEGEGVAPMIRFITGPDVNGQHRVEIHGMEVKLFTKHRRL